MGPLVKQLGRRASFLLPLSFAGCRNARSPESAGEAFLDAYYIERDHQRALGLSADGALARVQREKELLAGTGGGGTEGAPRVYYSRKAASAGAGPGETTLTYELTIRSPGVRLQKEVQLTVKQDGDGYKVSGFTERDLPVPATP
jgi:hypothetical protein